MWSSYFAFDKFVPVVVGEGTSVEEKNENWLKLGRHLDELLSVMVMELTAC